MKKHTIKINKRPNKIKGASFITTFPSGLLTEGITLKKIKMFNTRIEINKKIKLKNATDAINNKIEENIIAGVNDHPLANTNGIKKTEMNNTVNNLFIKIRTLYYFKN
jgi:hypothetical protein